MFLNRNVSVRFSKYSYSDLLRKVSMNLSKNIFRNFPIHIFEVFIEKFFLNFLNIFFLEFHRWVSPGMFFAEILTRILSYIFLGCLQLSLQGLFRENIQGTLKEFIWIFFTNFIRDSLWKIPPKIETISAIPREIHKLLQLLKDFSWNFSKRYLWKFC